MGTELTTTDFDGLIAAQLGGVDRADIRQAQRLPDGYRAASAAELTFDPRLVYELALGLEDAHEIFPRYNYTAEQALALASKPVFVATYKEYRKYISEQGLSFKAKARMQAEDLLTHAYEMATDKETPAAVRFDIIQWTAKMGELAPKESKGDVPGGGSFSLNLIFQGGDTRKIEVAAPLTVEGEVLGKVQS